MIDAYDWAGGREALWRYGPATGPVVVAALPPFEEANRTRAFTVAVLRALGERGIGGALPDLPGQGESMVATGDATLADWRSAFAAAVATLAAPGGRPTFSLALRAGALVDTDATLTARWHLSPQTGQSLVRELERVRAASLREAGAADSAEPDLIAGNRISPTLLAELAAARPVAGAGCRTLRIEGDALPADRHIAGERLWRRAEPDQDIGFAGAVADDIAGWIATCGG